MTDKILKETFDRISRIEEAPADIDHLGEMEHRLDELRDGIQEFTEIQEEMVELRERLVGAIRSYAPESLRSWEAYGLARLAILIGNSEFLASDESIQDLIDKAEKDYQATKEQMGG